MRITGPFLLAILMIAGCNRPVPGLPWPEANPCNGFTEEPVPEVDSLPRNRIQGAILASRFSTFEDFQSVVKVEYFGKGQTAGSSEAEHSTARLTHCCNGSYIISEIRSGLDQDDITRARDGNLADKLGLLIHSPYTIANREEMKKIYWLARRRFREFGEGDMAFFDLALHTVSHINTPSLAYKNARDRGEKGYLNTFNHFIAQAFITSCFSEEIADFIGDMHELKNMPALVHGKFKPEELTNPDNNPVDNYADMLNNEWGQEIGKELKEKYGIGPQTRWTPPLLTNYLNDIQQYFSWAFQIGFEPFRQDDEVVTRFAHKMNVMLHNIPINVP
ncbi:MAG: hypothetical protein R3B47_20030 [Bacteroidia bacterium]